MDIRVSGHQVDTGESLRTRVAERLNAIDGKYFSRAISAQVTFGKGPHDHGFTCEVVAHVPQGVVMKATDKAADANAAFDGAAEKVEKQFRRHARRLKDHHSSAPQAAFEDGLRGDG
ncbi:ribosome hibernation-promoting factor, HPF/YfiA family [Allosphingosinicella sp.]|jgi:ribosomal subunit interface protein|uniref:ribosome hibernation-promoting factor, HPF/YfiA family n=1 Tax=Allosphingosinicella sp. TaxID=2823234 RepID=UPI003D73BFF0